MLQYPFTAFLPTNSDIIQSSLNRQITALGILEPRTLRRLQGERFGILATRLCPHASRPVQEIVGFALLWQAHATEAWNRLNVAEQIQKQRSILRVFQGTEPGIDSTLILTAELRDRLREFDLPLIWFDRFTATVSRFLESLSWEVSQRAIGAPPLAMELLARRQVTAGLFTILDLLALDQALQVSSAVWHDAQFQRARTLAAQMQALVHDAHIAATPSLLDSPLRSGDAATPEEQLLQTHASCLTEYTMLRQMCLQSYASDPAVARYFGALEDWLAGQLTWHSERTSPAMAA